nr:ceramide-1-phosphate transfer protein-like [Chelonoidis abingdonii]XP_032632479.1 ceramide-1-phosphate transfer protein-like [Chelonoidis abingdonii]
MKIGNPEGHRSGSHAPHYRTLQAMVALRAAAGLGGLRVLPPDQPPSGSRTLLRLHRALKWLELFLGKLGRSGAERTPPSCAPRPTRQPWPGTQLVGAAGGRAGFPGPALAPEAVRARLRQGETGGQAVLLEAVGTIAGVYNVTQQLYATRGLLELP